MNSSNETFYPLDYWLGLYGYPYIADITIAYVITPIWLLSLIFSIISLIILCKAPFFGSNFFNYMRLYVANCSILSLISFTSILAMTHRFFSIANTYEGVFYGIYVFFTAQNSLFLFSSCIEICLVVERILFLLPTGVRRIKLTSFGKFFLILVIICFVVNVPAIFLFEPAFADVQVDPHTPYRVWYIGLSAFSYSLTGQVIYYLGYLFREVLPMVLKIILNFASIYLVGNYIKNKQRIRGAATTADSHLVNFDRNQTYIALIMNLFSMLEHMLTLTSFVLFYFEYYELSNLVYALGFLFIAIKHFLIFFILLVFNNLFRNEIKSWF